MNVEETGAHPPAPIFQTRLAEAFLASHRSPANVALHLVTTPLGLVGAVALAGSASPWGAGLAALGYIAWLRWKLPWRLWLFTAVFGAALVVLALAWAPGSWIGLLLLAVSYLGQAAAHYLTGEDSYESSYRNRSGAWRDFLHHTLYLLPLVFLAAAKTLRLGPLVAYDRVVHTKLPSSHHADLQTLRAWVTQQTPSHDRTTHWWPSDLTGPEQDAFRRLVDSEHIHAALQNLYGPDYRVQPLEGLNEVYVAGPDPELSSDKVFYRSHIDGPLGFMPFVTVFRCMVAVSPNDRVVTHFPMTGLGGKDGRVHTLDHGEMLGFDYHRELHYISARSERPAAERRITLKLHYIAYPRFLSAYGRQVGRWSVDYNLTARNVFLKTLRPAGAKVKAAARWVVLNTDFWRYVEQIVGTRNLGFLLLLSLVSLMSMNPLPLLAGASFIHYFMYLATYHFRTPTVSQTPLAFPRFVRDAALFKTVSMTQLAFWYLYFLPHSGMEVLASIPLAIAGFGLSALAYIRLGKVRTYFGEELGLVPPQRIAAFPYGTIPHPMILGALVGLIGVGLLGPLAARFPWLVPIHILLYLLVLTQEVFGSNDGDQTQGVG